MIYYLAGPMSGIPKFNFPCFNTAARHLRMEGHFVFNPAESDTITDYGRADVSLHHGTTTARRAVLAEDTNFICWKATAIAMLPGWENSKGARAEHALAVALGLHIRYMTMGNLP